MPAPAGRSAALVYTNGAASGVAAGTPPLERSLRCPEPFAGRLSLTPGRSCTRRGARELLADAQKNGRSSRTGGGLHDQRGVDAIRGRQAGSGAAGVLGRTGRPSPRGQRAGSPDVGLPLVRQPWQPRTGDRSEGSARLLRLGAARVPRAPTGLPPASHPLRGEPSQPLASWWAARESNPEPTG